MATLVFYHLSAGNVVEADRISDLVPMKVYRLPDPEHTDHFERLRRLTLYFGLEHWRYQSCCHAAEGAMIHFYHAVNISEADDDIAGECLEAWQMWESRLLSLDAAIETVCSKHNVDVATVRHQANIEGPYRVLGLGKVDPHLLAEMTQAFDKVLEGNS
jgi:hypothetical protein